MKPKLPVQIPEAEDCSFFRSLTDAEAQVCGQWSDYDCILSKAKVCARDIIFLSRPPKAKGLNKAHYKGNSALKHPDNRYNLTLDISQSYTRRGYNINLRCKESFTKPLFRFDAAGGSHTNRFPEIPLEERVITTPHFNRFRKDGRAYAYKTPVLEQANEAAAIVGDINFGLALFCKESKCARADGAFPEAQDKDAELPFPGTVATNFDHISFD